MSNCYRYEQFLGLQQMGAQQLVSKPADPWSHGCPQSSPYFSPQQPWPYPTPSPPSSAPDPCGMYYTLPYSYHASMPVDPFFPYSTTMQSFPSTQMHQQQQQYYCAPCLFDKITVQNQLQQSWRQQHGDHDPQQPYVSSLHRVSSLHSQKHAPQQLPKSTTESEKTLYQLEDPDQVQQHGNPGPHQQNVLQFASPHSQAPEPEQPPQKQQQKIPVKKLGSMSWCRRCNVDCTNMEGLVLHAFTSEHQLKTKALILSIKQNMQSTANIASKGENMVVKVKDTVLMSDRADQGPPNKWEAKELKVSAQEVPNGPNLETEKEKLNAPGVARQTSIEVKQDVEPKTRAPLEHRDSVLDKEKFEEVVEASFLPLTESTVTVNTIPVHFNDVHSLKSLTEQRDSSERRVTSKRSLELSIVAASYGFTETWISYPLELIVDGELERSKVALDPAEKKTSNNWLLVTKKKMFVWDPGELLTNDILGGFLELMSGDNDIVSHHMNTTNGDKNASICSTHTTVEGAKKKWLLVKQEPRIKLQFFTIQTLETLQHLHDLGQIHYDLKTKEILVKSSCTWKGKVIGFGSSCFQADHLNSYVQLRSYHASEIVLGLPYIEEMGTWSLGGIIAELGTGNFLLQTYSPATREGFLLCTKEPTEVMESHPEIESGFLEATSLEQHGAYKRKLQEGFTYILDGARRKNQRGFAIMNFMLEKFHKHRVSPMHLNAGSSITIGEDVNDNDSNFWGIQILGEPGITTTKPWIAWESSQLATSISQKEWEVTKFRFLVKVWDPGI